MRLYSSARYKPITDDSVELMNVMTNQRQSDEFRAAAC